MVSVWGTSSVEGIVAFPDTQFVSQCAVEIVVNKSESQIILQEAKTSVVNERTRAKTDGAQNDTGVQRL
jgi:hypothetical protein